jgi:transcriptional regulator with XRE-family HTH domain
MAPKRETALELWGKEFARAREEAGLSQVALAKDAYISPSLIGMWEIGRRTPKPEDLARCEERLGTKGRLAWSLKNWVPREVAHEWLDKWIEVEEQATQLLWFETSLVPGLLQTERYAQTVLSTEGEVAARLARQKILDDENPPILVALLDESVLRRKVGDAAVMYEQLGHLAEQAQRDHIRIHVLPLVADACAKINGPFVIAGFAVGNEVLYLDNAVTGEVVEDKEALTKIHRTWELLRSDALSKDETIKLILKVAEEWKI